MRYEILNDSGAVINTILSSEEFVASNYPGHYRLVVEPVVVDRTVESKLQSSNYAATKQINIDRLLKQGKVAEAMRLKGGL